LCDQLPGLAVKVLPWTVVPEIVGGDVLTGGLVAARAAGSPPSSPRVPKIAAATEATLFGVKFPTP
jgi:hypothetical protein